MTPPTAAWLVPPSHQFRNVGSGRRTRGAFPAPPTPPSVYRRLRREDLFSDCLPGPLQLGDGSVPLIWVGLGGACTTCACWWCLRHPDGESRGLMDSFVQKLNTVVRSLMIAVDERRPRPQCADGRRAPPRMAVGHPHGSHRNSSPATIKLPTVVWFRNATVDPHGAGVGQGRSDQRMGRTSRDSRQPRWNLGAFSSIEVVGVGAVPANSGDSRQPWREG